MDIERLFDILTQYETKYPHQQVALAGKRDGAWVTYTPAEYVRITNNISYAFIKLGIQPGDKIGIISTNRPEWNMLDMAIMQTGAVTVPVYPTISVDDYRHIVNHSEMRMVVLEGLEIMNKIKSIVPDSPKLEWIYTFIDRGEFPYLAQLIELGEQNPAPEELNRRREAVKPEDCSTIMYTSGTTGTPKGVMLSHYNIVSQLKALRPTPSKWSNKAFSFLPLCHAYERMLVFLYQHLGMSVYYAQNLGTIGENIKEINPTMMSAVPRVLEKMYDKIWNTSKNMKPLPKKIFRWAIAVAQEYKIQDTDRTFQYNCKHFIANVLVYRKIRKGIGGHFDIVVSGAASIQPRLASFFSAIGVPVFEGYGSTETSPVIAVSSRQKYSRDVGTVGFPLTGVEIKIAGNGEILCRGHNVMMGYYKDEALTREVIDTEGWFHTGDLGKFTPRGQLVITGRLKNLFKTSFGKYVNPQLIEDKCCESPFIENMVIIGENQKFVTALISPDFDFLKSWCLRHDVPYTSREEIIKNDTVIKRFGREITKYNTLFGETEQVKKIALIADEWSVKTGILTPTLKVKRHVVYRRYTDKIEELYK